MDKSEERGKQIMVDNYEMKARIFGIGMVNPESRFKEIPITDIPIMITQSNKILCIPITDEVRHIGATGMCYDKETEVLTEKGWKLFSELDKTELIAQVDPETFEISFVKPIRYVKKKHTGKMIHIDLPRINLLVTYSHNMFVGLDSLSPDSKFKFVPARELLRGEECRMRIVKEGDYTKPIFEDVSIGRDKIKRVVNYQGHVYCVEVPTHLLIVRRGGDAVLCANTGTSKTLFINSLVSWQYWSTNNLCLVLNDFQQDTFEWSMPADNDKFIYLLKKINVSPCPTPMVYVFPSTKTLRIEEDFKKFPHIKMTLPIEEVIKNVDNYYSLDKSKVYLGNLLNELTECNSIEEIREVLDENIPERHTMMKYKLMNIFEALFENNMLNVAVPDAPAYLEMRNKKGRYYNLTLQTLMASGIIPSVQTSDLRNQDYFAAYIAFIVDSLYRNQYEDSFFMTKTVSLFVDEIDKIWQGHNGDIAKKALNLIGTNGRTARIGMIWSTQHYDQISDQIRGNTKFLFVSRKANAKEVNDIRKDFNIPKSMDKDILNLKTNADEGIFELVAMTTEHFVLYDMISGKKTISSEAQRGILIPPPSRHHCPQIPLIK